MKKKANLDIRKLAKQALGARAKAYAPYSLHPVGAAIVAGSGKVYTGANVEVAHYKGLCAEASAIAALVTAGERKISAVVVVGPGKKYIATPCGDCRQRIREFSDKNTLVFSLWSDGRIGKIHTMEELLPNSFGPENMNEILRRRPRTKK